MLTIALVGVLWTSGCTAFSESLGGSGEPSGAAAMSRTVFERSPVVVVARADDRAGVLLGSSAAVGLGVPLLLEPEGGAVSDVLASELDRLGVEAVLAVGEADGSGLGSAT